MINRGSGGESKEVIRIVIVDDIPDTRESIKKLLAFEDQEFKVVGTAGTGVEAVKVVQETMPDIVLMDINMPDMDGIEATNRISNIYPAAAVIIMSVQADNDYFRKAMLAGARNYLTKPVQLDELYNTIRAVYKQHEAFRRRPVDPVGEATAARRPTGGDGYDNIIRAGHIIVVFSPQGGAGCTTLSTNLATGLMKKGIKVLLVDANIQFGDIGVFLKLQSQSTLHDLVDKIDDLDTDFFDSVVATHESGLKVLLGPPKLDLALEVEAVPNAVSRILEKVASHYDFVVVDCANHLNEAQTQLFDMATRIVLVATPTLASIKNTRFMLDLFDRFNYVPNKTVFVLNQMEDERTPRGQRVTVPTETIERYLKRQPEARIPYDQRTILSAVNKGVPVISLQRDRSKSPIREMVEFADHLYNMLMGETEAAPSNENGGKPKTKTNILSLGRR